jgi:hypothetical protein
MEPLASAPTLQRTLRNASYAALPSQPIPEASIKTAVFTIATALAFAFTGGALAATGHDLGHGQGVQEAALEFSQGRKWPTDESLRQAMENIRAALLANMQIFHGVDDSSTDYGARAAQVTGEVAVIVQNRSLDPLADAQLHGLIGQIVSGAETMEGKQPGVSRRAGAERIAEALGDYARTFEHPGW